MSRMQRRNHSLHTYSLQMPTKITGFDITLDGITITFSETILLFKAAPKREIKYVLNGVDP